MFTRLESKWLANIQLANSTVRRVNRLTRDYKLATICNEDMSDLLRSLITSRAFSSVSLWSLAVTIKRRAIIRAEMMYEIIVFLLLSRTVANARVYYIDDSKDVQKSGGISYDNINNFEQSSRDLDLSFSTGDTSNDNNYYPGVNYPIFKRVNPVRPYGTVERQYLDINNKEMDRPRTYKLIEVPERSRPRFEEIIVDPKKNAKLTQSAAGDRKGEVILELRVITNNDAI